MQADTDLAMLMLESSSNASESASRLDAVRATAEASKQVHCTVWVQSTAWSAVRWWPVWLCTVCWKTHCLVGALFGCVWQNSNGGIL